MIVIVLFVGLLTLGLSGRSAVHPAAESFVDAAKIENIECRESQPASALEAPGPSRAGNFRIAGSFDCHRPVFAAEDRNPYIERVLDSQTQAAKRVALSLKDQMHLLKADAIAVQVEGIGEPQLGAEVAALYRVEIAAVLGVAHVRKAAAEDLSAPLLTIHFHKADVPELMTTTRLKVKSARGEVVWLTI